MPLTRNPSALRPPQSLPLSGGLSSTALRTALALCLAACAFASTRRAAADTLLIDRPGAHPRYSFEIEPHLALGLVDPPGPGHGTGYGLGARATIPLIYNGFVATINNSIGVGFGLDFVHYGNVRGRCNRLDLMGNCQDSVSDVSVDALWLPVVMQWNFWLSRNWSVFGEPGIAFRYESNVAGDKELHFEPLQLYLGGRLHFSDAMTLTMRVGYPTFTVGLSFLL
ncbi:MAG TPA: hypothetical protein VFQ61_13230 [Polyangiaceae bacterium]|nr:hypothetical protein [Polyangiaceae bacterium]